MIKVLMLEPNKEATVKTICKDDFNNEIKKSINGYLRVVPINQEYILIINDEQQGLEPNRLLLTNNELIRGTIVIAKRSGKDLLNITENDINWLVSFVTRNMNKAS